MPVTVPGTSEENLRPSVTDAVSADSATFGTGEVGQNDVWPAAIEHIAKAMSEELLPKSMNHLSYLLSSIACALHSAVD